MFEIKVTEICISKDLKSKPKKLFSLILFIYSTSANKITFLFPTVTLTTEIVILTVKTKFWRSKLLTLVFTQKLPKLERVMPVVFI